MCSWQQLLSLGPHPEGSQRTHWGGGAGQVASSCGVCVLRPGAAGETWRFTSRQHSLPGTAPPSLPESPVARPPACNPNPNWGAQQKVVARWRQWTEITRLTIIVMTITHVLVLSLKEFLITSQSQVASHNRCDNKELCQFYRQRVFLSGFFFGMAHKIMVL